MQTYILPPREIGRLAAMTRSAGADWWLRPLSGERSMTPHLAQILLIDSGII